MIAEFPVFSPLQVGDHAAAQALTAPYAPYSDFNFTSLYAWDTREQVRVSVLNDNLVVRFTDYTTSEPFYSFIGDNDVEDTASRLLSLAESEGLPAELRLVPDVTARRASTGPFRLEEDCDSFDYILSIERIRSYHGNKLGPKRNFVNRFNREHEALTVVVSLADVAVQARFLDMFHRWMLQKGDRADNAENELLALHRAMFAARFLPDVFAVATFVEGDLAGFSISEILNNGYGMIHFEKADATYLGICPHLMQQVAHVMEERGCHHINYEQDLGLRGLRRSKRGYVPQTYLRKYSLRSVAESLHETAPDLESPGYFLFPAGSFLHSEEVSGVRAAVPPGGAEPLAESRSGREAHSIDALLPSPRAGQAQLDLPPLSRADLGSARTRRTTPPEMPGTGLFQSEAPPEANRWSRSPPSAARRIQHRPIPREEPPEHPPSRALPARKAG